MGLELFQKTVQPLGPSERHNHLLEKRNLVRVEEQNRSYGFETRWILRRKLDERDVSQLSPATG